MAKRLYFQYGQIHSVFPLIIVEPKKIVIPKEKVMLCLFSFGTTIFLGATNKKRNTVHSTHVVFDSI